MSLADRYDTLIPILTSNTSDPRFVVSFTEKPQYGTIIPYAAFDGKRCQVDGDVRDYDVISHDKGGYLQVEFDKIYFLKGLIFFVGVHDTIPSTPLDILTSTDGTAWEKITSFSKGTFPDSVEVPFDSKCKFIRVGLPMNWSAFNHRFYIGELNFFYSQTIALLKYDGRYYSIKESMYDSTLKKYNAIPESITAYDDYYFDISDLSAEVTIGDETFKPIDKFNNFSIVMKTGESDSYINGLKSNLELIVAKDDIQASIANHIDSFTLEYIKSGDADMKLILSVDSGNTWLTWNTSNKRFEPIPVNISKKYLFSSFTEEEKADWYSSAALIMENGIDTDTFHSLDFNKLIDEEGIVLPNKIRFAYAIQRNYPKDEAVSVSKLSWQFDAKGHFQEMTESEKEASIYGSVVKVKSLIDTDMIKVNIMV